MCLDCYFKNESFSGESHHDCDTISDGKGLIYSTQLDYTQDFVYLISYCTSMGGAEGAEVDGADEGYEDMLELGAFVLETVE